MLNVSSAFKTALENDWRKYIIQATITLQDETVLTITNENLMVDGNSIEDGLCADSSFSALGATPIGSCILNLNNVDETYSTYDFTKAKVVLKIGLEFEDGTQEIINRGVYYVDAPTYTETSVSLYCLDNMYRLDYTYDSNLVYPASLQTIVRDICDTFGLDLNTQLFPQNTFVVNESPKGSDVTYREVLGWCAEIAGCYARCDVNGGIIFDWFDQNILEDYYNNQDESGFIQLNSISEQSIGLDDIIFTGVILTKEGEEERQVTSTLPDGTTYTYNETVAITETYSYGTTDYAIQLNSKNAFITENNAQSVVDRLGAQLVGLRYRQATISHLSIPYMQSGDIALLTDRKGNKHVMLITRTNFVPRVYQQTVSAGQTVSQNSSVQYSALTKQYSETRQEVYKEIQAREKAVAELAVKISESGSGLYATQVETPPGSGSYIYYYHNKPELEDSDIQLVISTVGVTVTANGTDPNPTWYGLTVDGNLISNILNTVGVNASWINTGQLVVKKEINGQDVEMLFIDCDTGTIRLSNNVPAIDDARKVATNYLTYEENTGLDVGYSGTNAKTRITGNGVEIFDLNGDSVAAFSASIRMGQADSHHILISNSQLQFYNANLEVIGEMGVGSDAIYSQTSEIIFTGHPESDGTAYGTFDLELQHDPILSESGQTTNGVNIILNLIYLTDENPRVAVNNVTIYEPDVEYELLAAIYYPDIFWVNFYVTYVSEDKVIRVRTNPNDGKVYSMDGAIDFELVADYSYYSTTINAPYYTFGTRLSGSNKSTYSAVIGYNNEASATSAISIGRNNKATGESSFAGGSGTQATGESSFAIGINTLASGTLGAKASIACGIDTQAFGDASFAGGYGTIAGGAYSFVIGSGNTRASSMYPFVIGNGNTINRSDLFYITSGGYLRINGSPASVNLFSSGGGSFNMRRTNMSATIGQDIPSETQNFGMLRVYDSNGQSVYYNQTSKGTDDRLYQSFVVRRLNASGTDIRHGFYLGIQANGTRDVTFYNNASRNAWVNGLGMGTVSVHSGNATNVTTANDTTLCNSGSLAAGTYIIKAMVQFAVNASGRRTIFLSTSSTGSYVDRYTRIIGAPAPSSYTEMELTYITTISSDTTYYLRAYQNSGSTLSCIGGIEYVKLR